MAKYEHELSAFEGLGLDDVEMDAALTFLLGLVQPAALGRRGGRRPAGQRDGRGAMVGRQRPPARPSLRPGKVPTAARVGAAAGAAHGAAYDPDHAYTFGLQHVLDGLGALVGTGGA